MKPLWARLIATSVLAAASSGVAAAERSAVPDPGIDPGRLADRRAIERVLWSHRIWPEANRTAKPDLASVLPDSFISERVKDDDRKRMALERYWSWRITAAQVQAEIDRMAARTKAPKVLAEIFSALDNDPQRIASALAEPALVDRLIRSWYAGDGRFQAAARGRAERALQRPQAAEGLRALDGDYLETEYLLRDDGASWGDLMLRLHAVFDGEPAPEGRRGTLPRGLTSRLIEEEDAFRVYRILDSGDGRIRVASVAWPKQSFESWLSEARPGVEPAPSPLAGRYVLPALAGACIDDTWSPMASESPTGRTSHTAVWTGSEMIVWGGRYAEGLLNEGARYTPATDTWVPTAINPQTPAARSEHTAIWTGTRMLVWGGSTAGSPQGAGSGGSYDPLTDTWTSLRNDATTPSPRTNHVAVWTGTRMIVWGGNSGSGCNCGYTNTGGLYDPGNDTWAQTRADATAPSARASHTLVWTGSEMIVFGGFRNTGTGPYHLDLGDGGRYSPATDTWVPLPGGGGTRWGHVAVWSGTRMVVWGGGIHMWDGVPFHPETTTLLRTGSRFDVATGVWTPTSVTPVTPTARTGHTAVWTGSRMIVWGGQSGPGAHYDPITDDWYPMSAATSAPPQVSGHTAVWTGSEMIAWGGGTGYTSVGGRYDPATDSWVRTRIDHPFPAGIVPQGPAAVWTGTEMLVWSGPAAGGRYLPATDAWSAITGVGSPTARVDETGVWTGTEMIIWGGNFYTGTQTGGAYNPTTNQWTTTDWPGQPLPRYGHTAVWTGSQMVVWGGHGGGTNTAQSTGGRYNPSTHVWLPTRADGTQPIARYLHSAVWTGSEMIVWGGYDPNLPAPDNVMKTGSRYSPASDSWVPLPFNASTPDPRYTHQAVWTGTEMIAWGGDNTACCNYPSRGWAYSPGTDSWRSLPDDGTAPEGRSLNASVWSGTELIVWGGYDRASNTPYLNSGGRYSSADDSWTPTRLDPTTPIPRTSPAAVHTGEAMLVWGGKTGGGLPIKTGAAYCACALSTLYLDSDGDGHGDPGQSLEACGVPAGYSPIGDDCSDQNGQAWDTPGEATDLILSVAGHVAWVPPAFLGGSSVLYDVVRSTDAADFLNAGTCVASGISATVTLDQELPEPGLAFFYLVRAVNGCPDGTGVLGTASNGTPVPGPACP